MLCKQKKILFISRTLRGGGAERFISTFCSYLAEEGWDISILLYERSQDEYSISPKIKLFLLPERSVSIFNKFRRIIDMYNHLRMINPDVIIPFVDTVVICSFLSNIILRKKFVYTVRVSPWHESLTSSKIANFFRKYVAMYSDAIMLQNMEQCEFFSSNYSKKVYIVPNPIPEIYKKIKKDIYNNSYKSIVMTGRLDKQKNIQLMIKALKEISGKYKSVKLFIYGDGVEKSCLEKLISFYHLEKSCYLMGRCNNIPEMLVNADLYILTSEYEGMPNALMEAMAVGLPCISSNCKTGPSELIKHKYSGLLFENNNLTDLIDKLEWALSHEKDMNNCGCNARETIISNYSIYYG